MVNTPGQSWHKNPDKYTEYKHLQKIKRQIKNDQDREKYLQNARDVHKAQTSKKLTVRFYTYRIQIGDVITPDVVKKELADPETKSKYKKVFRPLWKGDLCSYDQLVNYKPRTPTDDERNFMEMIKPVVDDSPSVSHNSSGVCAMTMYWRKNPDKYAKHLQNQRIYQNRRRTEIKSVDAEKYLKEQRDKTKFKRHRKATLEFYDNRITSGEIITTDVIKDELSNPQEIKVKRPRNMVSFEDLVKYAHSRQAMPHLVCNILKN